ncbi:MULTISPECIES: HEAT repeat domain-containing protein [Kitasatospora]|uniref:Uncharacterized protein n=1 Tax=Kitasatospora setae (strain ATCC 33774 / DSM 43861 / JCM 3304 / KCC A-0304 / NBRC 14216 / KM-6054) TaxID=452652 RepID=E4N608_KITSK|nr:MULTISPECIES: HEAT repeat domain-containing protein [Kitasatospora]BAJ26639.1 hypothetical protein KSE_08000 [Kitasatospora setae KM-6054]
MIDSDPGTGPTTADGRHVAAARSAPVDDALRAAGAMAGAADPAVRAAGHLRLGRRAQVGVDEVRAWVADAVLALAADERDAGVLPALVRALESTQDGRALPVLLGLAGHPAWEVREAVARGLPFLGGEESGPRRVRALLALSRDEDPDVRGAAVFSLGTLEESPDPAVPDALRERLADADPDVAAEAVRGLARRRGAAVVPRLLALLRAEAAGADGPHPLTLSAAAVLGQPELLPALAELAAADAADERVGEALAACDPERTGRLDALAWEVLTALHARRPDLDAALSRTRFTTELTLRVGPRPGRDGGYCAAALLRRADDDPAAAAALVDADHPPAAVSR